MPTLRKMASSAMAGGGISLESAIPFPERDPIAVFINGNSVPIVGETPLITPDIIGTCLSSLKFKKWLQSINSEITVTRIVIQSVDMFGSNVGFIKLKADATFNGKPITGIVFIRGNSVAILVILVCGRDRWVVWTKQPRFAIGSSCCLEIPAGMMDDENNFVGVAAKELAKETGIKITGEKLCPLGEMHPSPGGCDDKILLFSYDRNVSPEELASFQGKCTGNFKEGEMIALKIMPYEETFDSTDAKAVCAIVRYEKMFLFEYKERQMKKNFYPLYDDDYIGEEELAKTYARTLAGGGMPRRWRASGSWEADDDSDDDEGATK